MNVSEPFIRRPIATALLSIGVLLLGLLGYRMLPIASLPSVDLPTILVTAQLPGAGPDVMAALVTAPLERQLGQIPSLAAMTSESAAGTTTITLQFDLRRDIDAAAQDVQAAINAASGVLPRTLPNPPTYSKVNPADTPILVLALTSDTLPLDRLNDLAETRLAQRLSQVTGVGLVTVEGNQKPAVRLQVNPAALASLGLGLEDIRTVIGQANANIPKGSFDGSRQAYTIGANDQILSPEAYGQIIIAYRDGAPVRLSDIGTAVESVENTRLAAWYDGKPAILLDIRRQPGANIIETATRIKEVLPRLQTAIPPGAQVAVVSDRTETIRASVADVQFTLVLTVGLVILVIFLFLRRPTVTAIPGAALPLSLIGTFGAMALCGFSLDNLSLMALTVAAGFVVDDAIVMIENIVRHAEAGAAPFAAALKGARQIGFTVISLTVSLIAVFLPLLFMTGVVGRLFREFAITLSIAVAISAVVSLTLTPMMCAWLLRPGAPGRGGPEPSGGRVFAAVTAAYDRSLRRVLRHRGPTLAVTAATLAATVWLYIDMPKGFLPQQDTGLIVGVTDADQTISFAAMAARQRQIADIVRRDPDVAAVASFVGAGTVNATLNTGRLTIALKPRRERAADAGAIIARLKQATAGVTGIDLFLQAVQDLQIDARVSRTQYQYVLEDADPAELADWAPRLLDALRGLPELTDAASDQQAGGLRIDIAVDRDKASRLGLTLQAIDDTLYDAFGQRQVSTIYTQTNQYHVILEVDPAFQRDPAALGRLHVRNGAGNPVPLAGFARLTPTTAPLSITHQGQFPAVTLSFNLAPGHSLGEAVAAIQQAERAIGLPDTVAASFTGSAAEFRSSLASEPWLILAAVVVIYIVLGVLYESTIHPITILSTLPSAGVGALLALRLFGHDLSLVALIGIVLLIGIVKKNAIMMIDFALDAERNEGLSPERSIHQACLLRFRPILMTTMAALFGALPLALANGTGSELRQPLGIAIVGGLLLSQLLTLYTTPVVYLYMDRLARWRPGRRAAPHPAAARPAAVPELERPAAE